MLPGLEFCIHFVIYYTAFSSLTLVYFFLRFYVMYKQVNGRTFHCFPIHQSEERECRRR